MKNLITLMVCATPLTALAHPGHGLVDQLHGVLHIEHLLALLAIAGAIVIAKTLK